MHAHLPKAQYSLEIDLTQQQEKEFTPKPWYKEPWPWLLMSGPAIVVVAGFWTLGKALSLDDTLVTDDYYKEGKNIIMQIERDRFAHRHNISAQVHVQPDRQGVMIITEGEYDASAPLNLMFIHTISRFDQNVTPERSANNPHLYHAKLPQPLDANAKSWTVRLEDTHNQWRVESRWNTESGNSVRLMPLHSGALDAIENAEAQKTAAAAPSAENTPQ